MSFAQTLVIALLTAVYLCFELAFNARLLDVVGGAASVQQVHNIEVFGRTLSGIAVALVVLQILVARRNKSEQRTPSGMAIAFWCFLSAALVYVGLQTLIDNLVAHSTAELRKTSLTIVLVQRALVKGQVKLDGLDDDPELFARPEGKAFLALFPAMAVSVDRLDDKVRDAKLELISRRILTGLGGAAGVYKQYEKATDQVREQFEKYRKIPSGQHAEIDIPRKQEEAWNDYVSDLGKRGWTPSTVPAHARAAVARKVRTKVPVPSGWNLADETTFKDAVANQIERRAGKAASQLKIGGIVVPPGLSWDRFFAHAGVQAKLRDSMSLPSRVSLQPAYSSAESFESSVVKPMVADIAKRELAAYEAPTSAFELGKSYFKQGEEAFRAVIVPPIALFFSLMGAIGHIAKLAFLFCKLVALSVPAWRNAKFLWTVPIALLLSAGVALSLASNSVTESRLFNYMRTQLIDYGGTEPADQAKVKMLAGALHWVAVGQGIGYPINEWIRVHALNNFKFGYEAPSE